MQPGRRPKVTVHIVELPEAANNTLAIIRKEVAGFYRLEPKDLCGRNLNGSKADAQAAAMWIAHIYSNQTFIYIGHTFACSTLEVAEIIRATENKIKSDDCLNTLMRELCQKLPFDYMPVAGSSVRPTVDSIQQCVAAQFGIKKSDMTSARRSVEVARPRQVAMYFAKKLTTRSLPEIGRKFGGRNHATVIHAIKRIEELRGKDEELNEHIQTLEAQFEMNQQATLPPALALPKRPSISADASADIATLG